jgi:hypothetical protein
MDAYGREDVLAGLYNADKHSFRLPGWQRLLRRRRGHSNYIQTVFSIPVLNFSYIDAAGEGVNGADYFRGLVKDNRIMSALKRCGYQTVAIESGFFFTSQPDVDVFYSRGNDLNVFENLLLSNSPWEVVSDELDLEPPAESYEAHRRRVLYSFSRLKSWLERLVPSSCLPISSRLIHPLCLMPKGDRLSPIVPIRSEMGRILRVTWKSTGPVMLTRSSL